MTAKTRAVLFCTEGKGSSFQTNESPLSGIFCLVSIGTAFYLTTRIHNCDTIVQLLGQVLKINADILPCLNPFEKWLCFAHTQSFNTSKV